MNKKLSCNLKLSGFFPQITYYSFLIIIYSFVLAYVKFTDVVVVFDDAFSFAISPVPARIIRSYLLLVKLQPSACNVTKSNTPPCLFFTFFKSYKLYQMTQSITFTLRTEFLQVNTLKNY